MTLAGTLRDCIMHPNRLLVEEDSACIWASVKSQAIDLEALDPLETAIHRAKRLKSCKHIDWVESMSLTDESGSESED